MRLWQWLNHKFYISIAWSPTQVTRSFGIRVWPLLLLLGVASALPWGLTFSGGAVLPGVDDSYLGRLKARIVDLQSQETSYASQLQVFAQEMGALQARLNRFEMIAERLYNTDQFANLLEDVPAAMGDGAVDIQVERIHANDLEMGLAYLSIKTDALNHVFNRTQSLLALTATAGQRLVWPVVHARSFVSSDYGFRRDPFHGGRGWHSGIDITGGWNAPIVAALEGTVTFVGFKSGYGLTVDVKHDGGLETRYAHLNRILVREGQRVTAGELLALMGSTGRSTGPHLHFEVFVNNERVDPEPFVAGARQAALATATGATEAAPAMRL